MILLQAFEGAYILLAAGGVITVLLVVAFIYLLARRHQDRIVALLRHEYIAAVDRWLIRRTPRLWRFIRRRFSLARWHGLELTLAASLVFVTIYGFFEIVEGWTDEELLLAIDRRVHEALAGVVTDDAITLMYTVTQLGEFLIMMAIGCVVAVVLYRRGYSWYAVSLLVTTVAAGIGLVGLKAVFGRARPVASVIEVGGKSFPSGHAFNSTVFYGYLIFLTWLLVRGDALRILITIVLTLLIFMIGLSRIYLGVHWVSDVVGGFTVGLAWLVGSLVLTRALRQYRTEIR